MTSSEAVLGDVREKLRIFSERNEFQRLFYKIDEAHLRDIVDDKLQLAQRLIKENPSVATVEIVNRVVMLAEHQNPVNNSVKNDCHITNIDIGCVNSNTSENELFGYADRLEAIEVINNYQKISAHRILHDLLYHHRTASFLNTNSRIAFLNSPIGSGKSRTALVLAQSLLEAGLIKHVYFVILPHTMQGYQDEWNKIRHGWETEIGRCKETQLISASETRSNRLKKLELWTKNGGIIFIGKELMFATNFKSKIDRMLSQLLIVDECHTSLRFRNKCKTLCNNAYKWKYSLFVSASILPEGRESILSLMNMTNVATGDSILGRLGFNLGLKRDSTERYIEELSFVAKREFLSAMDVLKMHFLEMSPLRERHNQSSEMMIKDYVVIMKTTERMQSRYQEFLKQSSTPEVTHNYRLRPFITIMGLSDLVLSPSSVVKKAVSDNQNYFFPILGKQEMLGVAGEDCTKMLLVHDLIRFYKKHNEKVIIFSRSLAKLNLLQKDLKARSILFTGQQKPTFILKQVERFRKREECQVMLMSITLAVGLNLQEASVAIFLEPHWSYDVIQQAIGRLARKGQNKRVKVFHLVYEATTEETVFEICIKKKNFGKYLQGENAIVSFGTSNLCKNRLIEAQTGTGINSDLPHICRKLRSHEIVAEGLSNVLHHNQFVQSVLRQN